MDYDILSQNHKCQLEFDQSVVDFHQSVRFRFGFGLKPRFRFQFQNRHSTVRYQSPLWRDVVEKVRSTLASSCGNCLVLGAEHGTDSVCATSTTTAL